MHRVGLCADQRRSRSGKKKRLTPASRYACIAHGRLEFARQRKKNYQRLTNWIHSQKTGLVCPRADGAERFDLFAIRLPFEFGAIVLNEFDAETCRGKQR